MRASRLYALVAAVLAAATPSLAQTNTTPQQPFLYDAQVTTAPVVIIPSNTARRSIEFCNPNAAITVAVCPVIQRRTGAGIVCAVNGRGSITLPPSACWSKTTTAQGSPLATAWYGVAASSTVFISAFETE